MTSPEGSTGSPGAPAHVPRDDPSIARNSFASLVANVSRLGCGFLAGAITARALGPSGKGALAALLFIGEVVLFYLCRLGLGDALIVFGSRREVSLQEVLAASWVPLVLSSLAGSFVLAGIAVVAEWEGIWPAVALEGVVLLVWVLLDFCLNALNAREQFMASGRIQVIAASVVALGTWLFVVVWDMSIFGAVLASAASMTVGLLLATAELKKSGLSLRPQWRPSVLTPLVRFGAGVQLSYLLIVMSQRFDQLLVYSISGEAVGGVYSVAITAASIIAFPPYAVSAASFPRLTYVEGSEFVTLTAQVSRVGLLSGLLAGAVMAGLLPFVIPLAFGGAYEGAIGPSLILLIGTVIASQQWILARALTARGSTGLKVRSFVVSLVLMVALDVILIPGFGMTGAAVASVVAATAGLAICVRTFQRLSKGSVSFRDFAPSMEDARLLVGFVRSLGRGQVGIMFSDSDRPDPARR